MHHLGPDELARYPFLPGAGKHLASLGFTLEQFGSDPDLLPMLERAVLRIESAADGRIYRSDGSDLNMEVLSFLLAAVLLRSPILSPLIGKFSLAEARRAEKFLERDLVDSQNKQREMLALWLLDELFSIQNIVKKNGRILVPVPDYLKNSVEFHEREWHLVNRRVESGFVYLTPHETIRLVRAKLSRYIARKIRASAAPPEVSGFAKYVEKLSGIADRFRPVTVDSSEDPPCIKHALDDLKAGKNLPHSARFMLAAFLLKRGKTIPEIAELFRTAPDFNEKITLYQLNQISGRGYHCPSCAKLKAEDLCFEEPACRHISNPLQFGGRR